PVFVLTGETGKFLPPLAFSYAAAMVASSVVAITAAPALAMLLLPLTRRAHASPLERGLRRPGNQLIDRVVRAPRTGLAVGVVLVLVGIGLLPFVDRGSSLVPELQDRNLFVRLTGAPGTSLTAMDGALSRASAQLSALPGVERVGGEVGRAI